MASLQTQVREVIKNELFLYFVAFLFGTNVIGYVALGKYWAIILMAGIGAITFLFTKNLAVIMMSSIVITSLFMINQNFKREGMEDGSDAEKKKEKKKEEVKAKKVVEEDAPAATPSTNDGSLATKKSNINTPSVDYATTINDGYKEILAAVGSGGIEALTTETKELMSTQKQLFDSMNQMAPAVKEAQNMLKNLNISGLDIKGLSKMLGTATSVSK